MQILEATKLPIRANESGDFSTTIIYSLPKRPGLFRRVSREGRAGLKAGEGNIIAIIPAGNREGEPVNGLCELVQWSEGEELLRPLLPGVISPNPDQKEDPFDGKETTEATKKK